MVFKKVFQDIQQRNARKKTTKTYYDAGKIYFSRLFGYARVGDEYVPIPKYTKAIKLIFQMLIENKTLPSIKTKLDAEGHRDSSNNRYTIDRICSVVRPIYSGYLKRGMTYTFITNIAPIVTQEEYKLAQKQLERELKKFRTLG